MNTHLKKVLKKIIPPFVIMAAIKILTLKSVIYWPKFILDYIKFKKTNLSSRFSIGLRYWNPRLGEASINTAFDHHYVFHPAWAARVIAEIKPEYHVDIGSTLHFATLVSAFIPTKFYDYRPADGLDVLSNLEAGRADLLNLPFASNSVKSLSCMHVVEHVGLGRYGDRINADDDKKAISELKRVLSIGGSLLFVVPISGTPVIEFNAHRIYTYDQIVELFSEFKLKEFSLVRGYNQNGGFVKNATHQLSDQQNYGCGCFWFVKQ